MTSRFFRPGLAPFLLAAVALSACGTATVVQQVAAPSPSVSSSPLPSPSPIATPTDTPVATGPAASSIITDADVIAVAKRMFPVEPGTNGSYGTCDQLNNGSLAPCPVTSRLRRRLAADPTSGPGGGSDAICRCQNTSDSRSVTADLGPQQAVAHVTLGYGGNSLRLDMVIIAAGGVLLVDDLLCTGRPDTSIYHTPVAPC